MDGLNFVPSDEPFGCLPGELSIEKAVYGATPEVGPASVDLIGKPTAAIQNGRKSPGPPWDFWDIFSQENNYVGKK